MIPENCHISLDYKTICFGHTDDRNHPVNLLIVHAKYYIYSCRQNNAVPDFHEFMYKFKFTLSVGYYIDRKNRTNYYNNFKHELITP